MKIQAANDCIGNELTPNKWWHKLIQFLSSPVFSIFKQDESKMDIFPLLRDLLKLANINRMTKLK